jgi:MarR family transcriptional regulator, 2-MHQ and catechol-resistance regulon repressor
MTKTWTYGPEADLALNTFVKLVRGYSTITRLEVAHIRNDYGLTGPQFGVLDSLGHLGAMSMCEISRKMLVTGGNITVVVDNLERDGLVKRMPNPQDRRSMTVDLTPRGRKLFDKIFPDHARNMTRMFSVLTEAEQKRLGELMKKLGMRLATGLPEES